jgi:hypothetical protein
LTSTEGCSGVLRRPNQTRTTSVYFACFHSEPKQLRGCSGQYATVEKAILRNEWPYDNGDDPSYKRNPAPGHQYRQIVAVELDQFQVRIFILSGI